MATEMPLEIKCAAASGDLFVDFPASIVRTRLKEITDPDRLQSFVASSDGGKQNYVAYFRIMPDLRPTVWLARARTWWWGFHGSGHLLTDARVPASPPNEWHRYEMPEPFWGHWHVLPFWAATTRDVAIEHLWRALSSYAETPKPDLGVRVSKELYGTEQRHRRAVERGAAVLADWDELEQPFPGEVESGPGA